MSKSAVESAVSRLLEQRSHLMLDIGCGPTKRGASWVGIDLHPHPGVELVGDALEILSSFPDGSIDCVYSSHFLEHLDSPLQLLSLLARKVRRGGTIEIVVPHFSNAYFYSDPTHKTPFGLYTMAYFCKQSIFHRQLPAYARIEGLELVKTDLAFKSTRPFYVRHALRRFLGMLINATYITKEIYEDTFPFIFPCYEVRFLLRRTAID